MEGLINVQKNLKNSIDKTFTNFKKSPKDRLSLEYVQIRLDNLEKYWVSFCDNNTKLYATCTLEQLQSTDYILNNIFEETEESYISCKTHLKLVARKYNTSPSSIELGCNPVTAKISSASIKLPKISIPSFSGLYSEWTTFHDMFLSLVHKNPALDDVQKLHYLKGHLTGEAELLVRHTPITASNYAQCWAQLEKRYNNKRYLSNNILKRLFSQKRMFSESASALKDILDTTTDCLSALGNLGVEVKSWDIIIIHIVAFKLDGETRKQWELTVSNAEGDNELPTWNQFTKFLESRFRALEFLEPKGQLRSVQHNTPHSGAKVLIATDNLGLLCEYCSEKHKLCFCKVFANQDVKTRRDFVAKNNICFNCLGSNHNIYDCKNPGKCRVCNKRHHSLLHQEGDESRSSNEVANQSNNSPPVISCVSNLQIKSKQVLLATAIFKAESKTGEFQLVRGLLDQGSQACFITESAVQLLRLKKIPVRRKISGVGNGKSINATHMIITNIQSRYNANFKIEIKAYVLTNITSYLPETETSLETLDWVDLNGLCLADPQFGRPNKIDVLLGADVFSHILKEGLIKSPNENLVALSTHLGWVLSGAIEIDKTSKHHSLSISTMHTRVNDDELLKKFWEIEEQIYGTEKILSEEEERCEQIFKETTRRTDEGRYIVHLPFKNEEQQCTGGNSRQIAVQRLKALEAKFARDKNLKQKYKEVINEYLKLEHMRQVKEDDVAKENAVYLPHHAVIRNDKTTTKLRVVFNASSPNNKGVSLNDSLLVGPTLQADLRHTITRWRVHRIALVADIIKMYRQVWIAEKDTRFQRIVWRDDPENQIADYELRTVTFGTASAPYLAVRAMHQVAHDEGDNYPLAADNVLNNFYMDDLMSGCAAAVPDGIELYEQLTKLLNKGGFKLQKWNSNNKALLQEIKRCEEKEEINEVQCVTEHDDQMKTQENENIDKNIGNNSQATIENTIKILGLSWNCNEDLFRYSVKLHPITGPVTKRAVLSDIARLFDPLGWLAPTIILAKMFIQKLWLSGIEWDEELPVELLKEWCTYREELFILEQVQISRWLGIKPNEMEVELHGFCDASKLAYAAVVYVRVQDQDGQIHTSLLTAKTRVAPIKQVCIPRLELCGAVLVAKLLKEMMEVLKIPKNKVKAWTDSTIVLAWLNSHPSRWKTFVGNRVSEILGILDSSHWHHVDSNNNPADCASRGLQPALLPGNKLWITGPQFLQNRDIKYNRLKELNTHLEENVKTHFINVAEQSLLSRFSSLSKLLRVVSYCRRFLKKNRTSFSYVRKIELDEAMKCCIKIAQQEEFPEEYNQLLKNSNTKEITSGKLKSLSPYLDHEGIMRVSGRLHNSQLSVQAKHPIVLPHSSQLTKLIVTDAHSKTLHGGPQLMLNFLRTAYWIIGARSLVKQHVHKCIKCVRERATTKTPFMGSLPSARCFPTRAFLHSGVDYAGPINIRVSKGRGNKSYKGYICLFVCMATRAIHLEAVSDMTSEAFMAAFRRFVSRRGHCAQLWSDNGTTFVGASKDLERLKNIQNSIVASLEGNGTEWHFIPPRAPNFGGLWEGAVKSTKHHLKRVLGDSTLTYEEMSTLLCQIEACLNSRPMTFVNTTDPAEPTALTPGHFLVGEPLLSTPDANYENFYLSSLTRWQLIQKMLQCFWRRWSSEYLSLLMQRYKWISKLPELKLNDIVLVKEDNLPPCQWLLGRVTQIHPGDDLITRVVTLRTKSSIIKRPVSKLCILPVA